EKQGNDVFSFPKGTISSLNSVSITAPNNTNDVFAANYIHDDPNLLGYNTANHAATVDRVSTCEYWDIKRLIGTSNVGLTFNYGNPCGGVNYITDPAQLAVVHWNGNTWEDLGNGANSGSLSG